jgi:CHAD domain-containing protein
VRDDGAHAEAKVISLAFDFVGDPHGLESVELGLDEPLPHGLRRITGGQFDRAISGLTDPDADFDTVVHASRKSLKRIRGLLRLVRDEIGYANYRNENVVLRDVGRRLAPVRDAAVMVNTLDLVGERFAEQMAPGTFAQTRAWLVDRHLEIRSAVRSDRDVLANTIFTLKAARARFGSTTVMRKADGSPYIRDSFSSVAPGITRVYRRGRRGYRRTLEGGTVEDLHEWRKRVKYLRYQLETLRPISPELLGSLARLLDDLGELLGHDHDLALLGELISDDPLACVDSRERRLLLLVIDDMRTETARRAIGIGSLLYNDSPAAFVDRLRSQWVGARTGGEAS